MLFTVNIKCDIDSMVCLIIGASLGRYPNNFRLGAVIFLWLSDLKPITHPIIKNSAPATTNDENTYVAVLSLLINTPPFIL